MCFGSISRWLARRCLTAWFGIRQNQMHNCFKNIDCSWRNKQTAWDQQVGNVCEHELQKFLLINIWKDSCDRVQYEKFTPRAKIARFWLGIVSSVLQCLPRSNRQTFKSKHYYNIQGGREKWEPVSFCFFFIKFQLICQVLLLCEGEKFSSASHIIYFATP